MRVIMRSRRKGNYENKLVVSRLNVQKALVQHIIICAQCYMHIIFRQ